MKAYQNVNHKLKLLKLLGIHGSLDELISEAVIC